MTDSGFIIDTGPETLDEALGELASMLDDTALAKAADAWKTRSGRAVVVYCAHRAHACWIDTVKASEFVELLDDQRVAFIVGDGTDKGVEMIFDSAELARAAIARLRADGATGVRVRALKGDSADSRLGRLPADDEVPF